MIVTGKGGTGKTTVAAMLGRMAARAGKKTIIVQIETSQGVAPIFSAGPAGYEVQPLGDTLDWINVQAKRAFEEYVLLQIKIRSLYRAVFGNRLVSSFIDAVPGLAELMCIGKIYVLTRNYDLTIVDAPATGHGISLLQIPSVVASAVRVGPLRVHSEAIEKMLQDPGHTEVLITTLPEEMPVAEAVELHGLLHEKLGIAVAGVVINQVLPDLESRRAGDQRHNLPEWAKFHQSRVGLQRDFITQLERTLAGDRFWEIPFSFAERMTIPEIDRLAKVAFPPL